MLGPASDPDGRLRRYQVRLELVADHRAGRGVRSGGCLLPGRRASCEWAGLPSASSGPRV